MPPRVSLAVACHTAAPCPSAQLLQHWAEATLTAHGGPDPADISVCLVDEAESRELNHRYRRQDKPTNVLSFPAELPPELNLPLLGDLVICAPVVAREAAEQGKSPEAHWAHMLVHGTLHLLGYDHINPEEAEQMEALETHILTGLHYPAPYCDNTINRASTGDPQEVP